MQGPPGRGKEVRAKYVTGDGLCHAKLCGLSQEHFGFSCKEDEKSLEFEKRSNMI